jgi:hypothetical protein
MRVVATEQPARSRLVSHSPKTIARASKTERRTRDCDHEEASQAVHCRLATHVDRAGQFRSGLSLTLNRLSAVIWTSARSRCCIGACWLRRPRTSGQLGDACRFGGVPLPLVSYNFHHHYLVVLSYGGSWGSKRLSLALGSAIKHFDHCLPAAWMMGGRKMVEGLACGRLVRVSVEAFASSLDSGHARNFPQTPEQPWSLSMAGLNMLRN